jgi:ABC-type transport system involved in multi-copper enzyme maturation permease subunit
MIRGGIVLAIARAEGRLTRRLVRYWVFVVVAWLVGVASYLYYGLLHRWSSAYGATMALLSPRYLIPIYGQLYLLIFMVGIVFLSFDVRARDVRERVAEVLDSRPYSNVELVLGRGLGILLLSWIPVVLITAFWAVLGLLIGESIEPVSLLDFLVFMSIPAFVFTVGLSFLASIALRFRLLSAVLVIAFLATMVFGGQFLPIRLSSLANVHGSFAIGYASDFVHFGAGIWGFAQRLAFVAAGISFALLAAALHPRLDDGSRGRRFAMGAAVAVVSALLFVGELHNVGSYLDDVLRWRDVHAGHEHDPAPDLLAMTADLRLAAPEGSPLEHALFSLNPGIVVASVTNAGGEELPFRFEDGLLDIDLPRPLAPGEETSVRLRAEGRPAENFAYLDAVRHPLSESGRDGALFLLGFQPMLFSRGSVALMPGCRWLPATGAEVGRGDPRVRPVDFFTLDLTVELPEGWLAAGPGRRQDGPEAPAGRVRYRFSPPAPVPEAALIAGRYESRSMDVEGVHFEALLHPSHVSNADFFEDAVPEIRTWLGDKLREARDLGLPYPYDALTLVEVPFPLRGYGGGWRMDTTFGPPAMVLVREASFPTARFDVHLSDASDFRDHEGGLPRAKREWLERFFENDFTGGNVFTAAARNFFTYQTSGTGNDGVPLDYVCDDLVTRLLTGKPGYFSAHIFNRDLNTIIGAIMTRWAVAGGSQSGLSGTELVIDAVTSRVEVWDQALGTSLSGLVPRDDPRRALDVLTLKGGAMARSLLDGLGSERVGHILGRLREQREGSTRPTCRVSCSRRPTPTAWRTRAAHRATRPF